MHFLESLAEALMGLTMALTPRIFERNTFSSLLGAGWAAAPWAVLNYWLFTAPLSIGSIDAGLLMKLLGSLSVLWTLAVFVSAWHQLYSKFRTAYETPVSRKAVQATALG